MPDSHRSPIANNEIEVDNRFIKSSIDDDKSKGGELLFVCCWKNKQNGGEGAGSSHFFLIRGRYGCCMICHFQLARRKGKHDCVA